MRQAAWALPWLLATLAAFAQSLQPIPPLRARVTDLTGTLTADQQQALQKELADFEARKGAQLAVLIVPTTRPEEIEQYSIRVVDQWQLGRKNVDDGALLLIAKDDHRLRIEVGRGLEGILPDAVCNRIITETITPALRQGDFYGGVRQGLDAMMKVVDGEPLPPPERGGESGSHPAGRPSLTGLLFAVLVGSFVLSALFGRTLGSLLTGAGAGLLVASAGYTLVLAALAGAGALLFSLLFARGGWASYPRYGGWYGPWGGFGGGLGGFGGGGFGGGGFGGGFGGGGGGFGGGGASGRW